MGLLGRLGREPLVLDRRYSRFGRRISMKFSEKVEGAGVRVVLKFQRNPTDITRVIVEVVEWVCLGRLGREPLVFGSPLLAIR